MPAEYIDKLIKARIEQATLTLNRLATIEDISELARIEKEIEDLKAEINYRLKT